MAKKTWIKVKRGLLDPKHIEKLGQAWYLYIYILDQADWETGTIKEWKDEYASNDLDKPIGLIREHRKKLIAEKYIDCEKNQHSQRIIIHNWTDPRRYDNHLLNPEIESMEKDELTDGTIIESSGQSKGQTTIGHGVNSRSSYNHINTYPHEEQDNIAVFMEISGITHRPKMLADISSWNKTLAFLRDSGVTDEIMRTASNNIVSSGGEVTSPDSIISECGKLLRRGENMENINCLQLAEEQERE